MMSPTQRGGGWAKGKAQAQERLVGRLSGVLHQYSYIHIPQYINISTHSFVGLLYGSTTAPEIEIDCTFWIF